MKPIQTETPIFITMEWPISAVKPVPNRDRVRHAKGPIGGRWLRWPIDPFSLGCLQIMGPLKTRPCMFAFPLNSQIGTPQMGCLPESPAFLPS